MKHHLGTVLSFLVWCLGAITTYAFVLAGRVILRRLSISGKEYLTVHFFYSNIQVICIVIIGGIIFRYIVGRIYSEMFYSNW